jgi:predicted transglutaminase-like cysteine proteinase
MAMVGSVLRKSLVPLGAVLFLTAWTGAALPTENRVGPFAEVGRPSTPPIGWVQFCDDQPGTCHVADLPPVDVVLDQGRWKELLHINSGVNREIEPETDEDQWGVVERWSLPTTGKGDCEDYVLEKRERLIKEGWPRQSLLVTVVRDQKGDGHAVLTVRTDRGDFVLDNQNTKILLWSKTGYQYIKRQAQDDPNHWVSLGGVDTGLSTANQ